MILIASAASRQNFYQNRCFLKSPISLPGNAVWVPLKQAIEELAVGGPIEAVALLLRFGANVEGRTVPGNASPLIVAAMNQPFEAAVLLLAMRAKVNSQDDEGDNSHASVTISTFLKAAISTKRL